MLTIAILNCMPDAAVRSTERQFNELLTEAAGLDIGLNLEWFSLQPREGYGSSEELWAASHIDGLIVTGTEPHASRLNDEPYWDAFAKTIDWATAHTRSAIWSCLGAHAAVLHLDNIERRPFLTKLHGVFETVELEHHPLLANTDLSGGVPHSRWNDLPVQALLSRGYRILTQAVEAGADLFVKTCGASLFLFFQSHLEYDARALMREYRRDVLRFLTGEGKNYPSIPTHYFDLRTERGLHDLRERAVSNHNPDVGMVDFQVLVGQATLEAIWKPTAVQLYRNWFDILVQQRVKCLVWFPT